jgi:hypothetical protein
MTTLDPPSRAAKLCARLPRLLTPHAPKLPARRHTPSGPDRSSARAATAGWPCYDRRRLSKVKEEGGKMLINVFIKNVGVTILKNVESNILSKQMLIQLS